MAEPTPIQPPEGFSADWLTLRESADHLARSAQLTQQLQQWAEPVSRLSVVELGAGTGSNLRYLCPLLGHGQHWILYDNDQSLLSSIPHHLNTWCEQQGINIHVTADTLQLDSENFSAHVQWQHCDLTNNLNTLPWTDAQLVTGSALLDLTSAAWLEQLATQCISQRCASFFVLNYNGTISWQEPLAADTEINTLLNAHQLKDKGFGPALGPGAHRFLADCLNAEQRVMINRSDWQLAPAQQALQQALIDGWGPAAIEQNPTKREVINRWMEQRSLRIAQHQSSLQVGHTDILSLPLPEL